MTEVQVIKCDDVHYNVMNLNFVEYNLVRNALTLKLLQLEKRLRLYESSKCSFNGDYLNDKRNEIEIYHNLLKNL